MADQASELEALDGMLSDANAEPTKLSYALIKSITNDFSREIGRGGFGVVYLGALLNGKVAVKKLSISQDFSDRLFWDEVQCLIRAKHNNIVRFLGYCADTQGELMEHNGRNVMPEVRQRLLCFEYVPNGSLHHFLKEKPRGDEWKIRYQMIKGICEGLNYLHKENINHLDLKPENVLLNAQMEPKITDFGLSRWFEQGQSRIITKSTPGTRGYIAPEIIDKGEITFKSDIFSLGIIVIKLLMRSDNDDTENWRESIGVEGPEVKGCIEIARTYVEDDPHNRPSIGDIIHKLNEMDSIQESRNDQGSSIHQLLMMPPTAQQLQQQMQMKPLTPQQLQQLQQQMQMKPPPSQQLQQQMQMIPPPLQQQFQQLQQQMQMMPRPPQQQFQQLQPQMQMMPRRPPQQFQQLQQQMQMKPRPPPQQFQQLRQHFAPAAPAKFPEGDWGDDGSSEFDDEDDDDSLDDDFSDNPKMMMKPNAGGGDKKGAGNGGGNEVPVQIKGNGNDNSNNGQPNNVKEGRAPTSGSEPAGQKEQAIVAGGMPPQQAMMKRMDDARSAVGVQGMPAVCVSPVPFHQGRGGDTPSRREVLQLQLAAAAENSISMVQQQYMALMQQQHMAFYLFLFLFLFLFTIIIIIIVIFTFKARR